MGLDFYSCCDAEHPATPGHCPAALDCSECMIYETHLAEMALARIAYGKTRDFKATARVFRPVTAHFPRNIRFNYLSAQCKFR